MFGSTTYKINLHLPTPVFSSDDCLAYLQPECKDLQERHWLSAPFLVGSNEG